jgi:hypothetical protein
MTYQSMRVCALGLAIAVSSVAAPAAAQELTFTDLRDAVTGKFFDAASSQQTATTLDIAFDNNEFKASTIAPLFTTATRSAMDTISFNVHAPAGQYVSSITYEQTGDASIINVGGASGASNWVIGGEPEHIGSFRTNPSLSQTVPLTDSPLTVVPVSITTGLFAFNPPTDTGGDATVRLTSAKVTVTFAELPTGEKQAATIDVSGYSGTYDGAPHGATGSATGVDGEDLTDLLHLGESFTDAGVGTANWRFIGDENYNEASGTVDITINKATPTIAWAQPAAITAGTALTADQLNATANVDGTFVYTPPAGTLLTETQALSASFTPADAVNYNGASATVSISVTADTSLRIVNPGAQIDRVGDRVELTLEATGGSTSASASGRDRRRSEWSASALPPGLKMEKDGLIRGRPTTPGVYSVGVRFTRDGATALTQFNWTILSR